MAYLDSHPAILAKREIMKNLHGQDYRKILAEIWKNPPTGSLAAGFKIFYYHPLDDKESTLWSYFQQDPELVIIHLTRSNLLRMLVSRKIAETSGVWEIRQRGAALPFKKKIALSAEECEMEFRKSISWQQETDRKFASHAMIDITYESLVSDPQSSVKRINEALGLSQHIPVTELRKQNPEPLSDLIENFEELKASFRGTKWFDFFE
jgi:LPS sulfotransferase NodH